MDRLKIILREQVEGAEHFIIFNVKRSCGLEVSLERNHRWWLDVELLWGAHLTELLMTLLSRHPGRPPRSAAVVIVGVGIVVLLLVLTTVVEELRHDYKLRWWQLVRVLVLLLLVLALVLMRGRLNGGQKITTKTKQRGSDSSEVE